MSLADAWEQAAPQWLAWSRAPGHDSYWRFHRDAFLRLVPAPGRLTVDVGSGEGRVTRDLAARGHRVVAVDASFTLSRAAAAHPDAAGTVLVGDAARLPLRSRVADLVVAFMCLQDVDEFESAVAEASRVLTSDGTVLIAIVHPLNSAGAFLAPDDTGRSPFVVSESWFERRRMADLCSRAGLDMTFHSEHRPLQAYADAITDAGLAITRMAEVGDPDPGDKWHRIPLFLHIEAAKVDRRASPV